LILHGVIGILELIILAAVWHGVGSTSKRNEYQGTSWGINADGA